MSTRARSGTRQRGAAVVEFALVSMILILLLFGLLEMGRALFKWNSAVDATRQGARTAAIVAVGDPDGAVLKAMRGLLPELKAEDVSIEYSIDGNFPGAACIRGTCRYVRVSVIYTFESMIFFLPLSIPMPTFATTLPVEALGAT